MCAKEKNGCQQARKSQRSLIEHSSARIHAPSACKNIAARGNLFAHPDWPPAFCWRRTNYARLSKPLQSLRNMRIYPAHEGYGRKYAVMRAGQFVAAVSSYQREIFFIVASAARQLRAIGVRLRCPRRAQGARAGPRLGNACRMVSATWSASDRLRVVARSGPSPVLAITFAAASDANWRPIAVLLLATL
jgi:hypothetical protein